MPLLQLTLIEGRSAEVKGALISELTDTVARLTDVSRESVRVILMEVPAAHWGVGGRPKSDRTPPSTRSDT